MPTYTYKCDVCGDKMEVKREMEERHDYINNDWHTLKCDGVYRLIITVPSIPFEHMRDRGVFDR